MVTAEALPQALAFVDLETTGASAGHDRITEVGIVLVRQGQPVEEWSSLVNPGCAIPEYIEAFTGISNSMVADAPRFAEIAAEVRRKLEGAVFVAHNARFDYSFLRSEFLKLDMGFSARVLCTVKLSRRLFPEYVRHNLDVVMQRHGLACDARHRALGDAKVIHDFWCKLRREVAEPRLAATVSSLLGMHRLPAYLAPGLADDLPEGPGAYRFFDAEGALLYVGKSNSLRARVCSHFGAEDAGSKDRRLARDVRRIDWVGTHGELGAMLREAAWIKTEMPAYNRRKNSADSHTLRVSAGAPRPVEMLPIEAVDLAELPNCFGVFHGAKQARKALTDIARAKQLCLKLLALEEGEGSCVAHWVGNCKGACIGKEPLILHNMRLQLALSPLKLQAWPFPGRIALREREPGRGMEECMRGAELHVIDRWAYLGTARTEEELAALAAKTANGVFDVDVYRILVRYFAKYPKLDWLDLRGNTICT